MAIRETGMLSVGEVARRTGLTAKALRHYDRIGLLSPARVSDDGYRWYDEEQVALARYIGRLRALDVPLDVVRACLDGADEHEVRRLLAAHRTALQARDDRIRRSLHAIDHLLNDERGTIMALNDTPTQTVTDERALAIQLFNSAWSLLEQESRTPEEDDRMLHMAHASRYHWDNVGDDQNRAIGESQCSRVYAVLGRGEPALFHARRCLEYAGRDGVDDWVAASAHEALARACFVAGDTEAARDARDQALALAKAISDAEDRDIVLADIDTLPLP
jgi:DNA-binding transcriptional MerR regulator